MRVFLFGYFIEGIFYSRFAYFIGIWLDFAYIRIDYITEIDTYKYV